LPSERCQYPGAISKDFQVKECSIWCEQQTNRSHTPSKSNRATFSKEVNLMKQNTSLQIVRNSLFVLPIVLLAACASAPINSAPIDSTPTDATPIKTSSLATTSAPREFVLRGMTSNSVGDPSYIVIATYNVQGPVKEEKISLTITGPAAWNDGQPFKTTLNADSESVWLEGNRWHLSFSPDFSLGVSDGSVATTPMMPGVYTATTTLAGKTLTSTVDVSNIMAKPVVSVDAASSAKVDVSWRPIPGAKQYYATLYNELNTVYYRMITDRTSVSFEDFKVPLDTTQNFSVTVAAVSEKVLDPAGGDIIPVNLAGSQTEVTSIF
jgi:hypothetical protein